VEKNEKNEGERYPPKSNGCVQEYSGSGTRRKAHRVRRVGPSHQGVASERVLYLGMRKKTKREDYTAPIVFRVLSIYFFSLGGKVLEDQKELHRVHENKRKFCRYLEVFTIAIIPESQRNIHILSQTTDL